MARTLRFLLMALLPGGLGCYYSGQNVTGGPEAVEAFSELEREASQYGFISAGAIRVAPYEFSGLKELRERIIKSIDELSAEFKAVPKPELTTSFFLFPVVLAILSAFYKGAPALTDAPKPLETNQDLFKALQGILGDLFNKSMNTELEANRIDLIRLRLGYLKYLDQEFANLKLMETVPLDDEFRRVVVSVQLTALVRREEAQGAMVLFDLYPLHADKWAHFTGNELRKTFKNNPDTDPEKYDEKIGKEFSKGWSKYSYLLEGSFHDGFCVGCPEKIPAEPMFDYEGWMHHYLIIKRLLPRIVYVEPLDVGELFNRLDLSASSTRLGLALGSTLPNLSSVLQGGYGSTGAAGDRAQLVNPLSLAFAAGDSRAGWVFLPSVTQADSPILRPTERRIRMVVDVPKQLRNVALHVHKMFTDESLRPIKAAPFDYQLRKLNQARFLLSESEKKYPEGFTEKDPWAHVKATEFKTQTNWELMKSRMRNILYQGWSEALAFEVPKEPEPAEIPAQTAVLEDDGEAQSVVVLRGGRGLTLKNTQAILELPRVRSPRVQFLFFPVSVPLDLYNLRAQDLVRDDTKDLIRLSFPSIKKWDPDGLVTIEAIKLHFTYPNGPSNKPFNVAYALKKKEKVPGFALKVPAEQVSADKDGRGQVTISVEMAKKGSIAKKMVVEVRGASVDFDRTFDLDKNKVKKLEFTSDQTVILALSNLSERFPVTISAKNEEDTPVPAVTLRVERLPLEPKKD